MVSLHDIPFQRICHDGERANSIFEVQLLTYLRASRFKPGPVVHFGEKPVIDAIHRVVNGL